MTKSTEIAIAANEGKQEIPLSELVPDYAQKFTKVFEKRAAERFPPSRPWDHKIEFNPEKNPQSKKWGKIYPLTLTEKEELRKFVDENLAKGFIRRSESPFASPFFFVKKKDGSLRPVQDYRKLNEMTVKNKYPLPLIQELVDKLKDSKVFTKMDIRWGYNNIRIKEGDEWKTTFKTKY